MFSRFFFSVLLLFVSLASRAQVEEVEPRTGSSIIDDSTKNVYGPTTTQYFYESEFFRNKFTTYAIDTAAWNFHRFNFVQRYNNFYQDLGNIGTAIRPVFNEVPETIGATPGFTAYDLYWNSENVKYYNTKSPFASVKWILGGKGRSYARFTFTRNVNPRWNVGFNYRILQIDKIVARSAKGDRTTKSNYFDIFTSYQSKDSLYSLFFNARRDFIQVDENGGVRADVENFAFADFFDTQGASPNLTGAESNDKRGALHLFHQLNLASGLQVYHTSDLYRQINRFNDADPDNNYYDFTVVDSAETRDRTEFKSFRNEVGVKGSFFKAFYNGYAAFRNYSIDYKYIYEDDFFLVTKKLETYLGGRIGLQLDSLVEVKGWAEWMLDDRYMIQGSIKTKWFEASAKRSVSTPAFVPQVYRGSHDLWINTFGNVEGTELKGNLIYESKRLSIYPGLRFSTFRNSIFFKEDTTGQQHVLPYQTSGYQTWASPELSFSVGLLEHLTLKGQGIYTRILENSDDAFQFPKWFVNAQLAYADIWFNGNFDFQAGVDVHWKSSYYTPGYDVTTQQFYTQQRFQSPGVPLVDLFLNVRIRHARIFLKYNNALFAVTKYGDVPTPFYPGVRNIVDFGFDWSFFD